MHLEAPRGQQGGVLGCCSFVSAQAPTQESFQARYFFFFFSKMRPLLLNSVGVKILFLLREDDQHNHRHCLFLSGLVFCLFFPRLWDLNFQTWD